MIRNIRVVKLGHPISIANTMQYDNSFVCPECKQPVTIYLTNGIFGNKYPSVPLKCTTCKNEYGICLQ